MGDAADRPGERIDPLIHAPARLLIVTQLYVVDGADATFLLHRTGLTWGNLSSHLSKLEEAGYVEIEKSFRGKKPCTMASLSPKGRRAFERYRSVMRETLAGVVEP